MDFWIKKWWSQLGVYDINTLFTSTELLSRIPSGVVFHCDATYKIVKPVKTIERSQIVEIKTQRG